MTENQPLTEAQYSALIEAFRTVAPITIGISTDEAQEWIAQHAEQAAEELEEEGEDESTIEWTTWSDLMLTISEDYSSWDADQVAEKCAAVANVPKP